MNHCDHPKMSRYDSFGELTDDELREVAARKLAKWNRRDRRSFSLANLRLSSDLEARYRILLTNFAPRVTVQIWQRIRGTWNPSNDGRFLAWLDRLHDVVAIFRLAQMIAELEGLPIRRRFTPAAARGREIQPRDVEAHQ